jgi:hypothetical protein
VSIYIVVYTALDNAVYTRHVVSDAGTCISSNVNDNVSDRHMYMHRHTHTAERQRARCRELYARFSHFVTESVCCRLLFRMPSMLQRESSTHDLFLQNLKKPQP